MGLINQTRSFLPCLQWFVLLICILGYGCRNDDPIKIGFIAGTSGRVADMGISGRDALQMIVEQYNSNGGINGRRIELLLKDDRQDPELAKKAAQELIEEGVVAIIGPMTSDMAMAVVPILNTSHIPAISPTATTQQLSGHDDFFFRVSSTTLEHATKSAVYHLNNENMRRIVAIYDITNRSFGETWLSSFKKTYSPQGGQIIAEIAFDSSQDRSFTEITNEVLANNPDGILIIANSMDSAMLCQQIRKVDTDVSISLADWGATERLLELGGKAVEGVTVIQTFDRNDPGGRYQAFRKAYIDRYQHEPGFPGVYTYDAAKVLLTAISDQSKNEDLKENILSHEIFQGLQSEFSFDEYGDVSRINASISVVRNQTFVVLE